MLERTVRTAENVKDHLQSVTPEYHFMEIQRREAQKEYPFWPIASAGILIGSIGWTGSDPTTRERAQFSTVDKLRGEVRSLRSQTLVQSTAIKLPLDMSEEGIDRFIHEPRSTEKTARHLGLVALHEPGLTTFFPVKTDVSTYIESTQTGINLAAEAVDMYLNTETVFQISDEEHAAVRSDATTTREAHEQLMRKALDSLFRARE